MRLFEKFLLSHINFLADFNRINQEFAKIDLILWINTSYDIWKAATKSIENRSPLLMVYNWFIALLESEAFFHWMTVMLQFLRFTIGLYFIRMLTNFYQKTVFFTKVDSWQKGLLYQAVDLHAYIVKSLFHGLQFHLLHLQDCLKEKQSSLTWRNANNPLIPCKLFNKRLFILFRSWRCHKCNTQGQRYNRNRRYWKVALSANEATLRVFY